MVLRVLGVGVRMSSRDEVMGDVCEVRLTCNHAMVGLRMRMKDYVLMIGNRVGWLVKLCV